VLNKIKELKKHSGFMKYFKNTSWLFGEKMLRMVIGLFIEVWVARYLGPEQFGLFSYAGSFVAIFTIIATMGIDGILVRELVKDEKSTNELLGTAFWIHIVGAILVFIVLTMVIYFVPSHDYNTNVLIYIMTSATIFHSFSVIDTYFRAKVSSKYIMYASTATILIISSVKILLIIYKAPLIYFAWVIVFQSIVLACSLLYFYYKNNFSVMDWSFDIGKAKQLLRDGWPLILSGVVTAIYMNTDRIMIKELIDIESVGQYAAASKISAAWYFIPMIISSSLFPAIIKSKQQGEQLYYNRLQKLYDLVVLIAFFIALPITFLSGWIIDLLYGNAYAGASDVLVIHIWTGIFIALWVVASKWFTIENYLQNVMVRTLMGAILNIILNFILIPRYGVVGAAWGTLLSYIFINYLSMFFFKKTRVCFYQQSKALNIFMSIKRLGL